MTKATAKGRKPATLSLPREANPVRVRSQYLRSRALCREAFRAYRVNPNPGTADRRIDRALATLSVRAKVRLVDAMHRKAGVRVLRPLARAYFRALARWQGDYRANRTGAGSKGPGPTHRA